MPTAAPSAVPSASPSSAPSAEPTAKPSIKVLAPITRSPTATPTEEPTTAEPTSVPTARPTARPTGSTSRTVPPRSFTLSAHPRSRAVVNLECPTFYGTAVGPGRNFSDEYITVADLGVTAWSINGGSPTISCAFPNPIRYYRGTTPLVCTAVDVVGQVAQCTITVNAFGGRRAQALSVGAPGSRARTRDRVRQRLRLAVSA